MIATLKALNSDFDRIIESPVIKDGQTLGWQTSCLLRDGRPLGSGMKKDRDEARRVACAEFIERSFFLKPLNESDATWCFDKFESACGLAVGFEKEKTIVRSVVEATERWVMTEWVLNQRSIPETNPDFDLVDQCFLEPFSSTRAFSIQIPVVFENAVMKVHVALLMAFSEKGVFFGSNASTEPEGLWTHACVESYRHWLVVKNAKNSGVFPFNRIFYFAENRLEAEHQIPSGQAKTWPIPKVEFFHQAEIKPGIFAARTIMKGFVPWNSGPINQFLY